MMTDSLVSRWSISTSMESGQYSILHGVAFWIPKANAMLSASDYSSIHAIPMNRRVITLRVKFYSIKELNPPSMVV